MPESSPAESGLSRRQVLVGSAIAAPAIVMATSLPARATSANSTLTIALDAMSVGAGYPVGVTATVLDSRGDPWPGQVVTFTNSDSGSLSFSASSAVTNSSGQATVTVSASAASAPGTRSITAASGPLATSTTVGVIAVTATTAVGAQPRKVSMSPDATYVYVSNTNSNNVSRVSTTTNAVTTTIASGSGPDGVAFSPDGSFVYITQDPSPVARVRTSDNSIVATIPALNTSRDVAISASGNFAYFAGAYGEGISRVDSASNAVTSTLSLNGIVNSATCLAIALSPDDATVWAGLWNSPTILKIDAATNSIQSTITTTSDAVGDIAISPNGAVGFIAWTGSDAGYGPSAAGLGRLDTASGTVHSLGLDLPGAPWGLAFSADGARLYVACSDGVAIVEVATEQIVAKLEVAGGPNSIVISPDESFGYVSCWGNDSVTRIDFV